MEKLFSVTPEQLGLILRDLPDGITVQDAKGGLLYVNRAAARLMGFESPEEALAVGAAGIMANFEIFNENNEPLPLAALPGRKAMRGEEESEVLVGFKLKDSKDKNWSSLRAMPVKDAHGTVQMVINVFQDVTRLKSAQEQLIKANQRITHILESVMKAPD